MYCVKITSSCEINGVKYKRNDILNVSSSIFADLTEVKKCAKPYKADKEKKVVEDDKEVE